MTQMDLTLIALVLILFLWSRSVVYDSISAVLTAARSLSWAFSAAIEAWRKRRNAVHLRRKLVASTFSSVAQNAASLAFALASAALTTGLFAIFGSLAMSAYSVS